MICLYSFPKNLKGSLNVKGCDEASRTGGTKKSPVLFPNGNKSGPPKVTFPNNNR